MLNVFREANGDVKLFVNYQQLNGKGLAGLSKSLDEMVQFINQFKLEQTGFVYLVDDKGIVRIHHDNQLMGKASLTDLYGSKVANQLLKRGKVEIADLILQAKKILLLQVIFQR